MAKLTFTQMRIAAAGYLVVLATCVGSYYLQWRLFGGADRKVLAVVVFIGVLVTAKYGTILVEESRQYRARRREVERDTSIP